MKSFKVAVVAACPFPANHGSPASIREMSECLAILGHDVHIVTYPNGQNIPVSGVSIHRVTGLGLSSQMKVGPFWQRPFLDLLMVLRLCRVVREKKIDIIHAHNYEGALIGYLAKLFTGRPLLYNAVNTMADELPSYRFIRPKILAKTIGRVLDFFVPITADYVTVVSEELYDFMIDRGIPRNRVAVVPAGVNPKMFQDVDPNWIRTNYHTGSRPVIIYTGTLDQFQRIDYLLKAMKVVVAREPQALLLICSNVVDTPSLDEHCHLATQLGITENVIWVKESRLEDLPDSLASADIAVLPRPSCPGHPVKLLNYMAAGKAIVAFKGSAKGLRHMYNGFLAEDHDWEGMGEGISLLLKEPHLARKLGENARASIEENFDWLTLVKGISVIYEKLMAKKIHGRKEADDPKLQRYLRKSYYPIFCKRRQRLDFHATERRSENRRKDVKPITFLERRKMKYE